MTVHAIRVETDNTSSGTPVETILANFRNAFDERLPEQAGDPAEVQPTATEALSEAYMYGLFRFADSEAKADLISDLDSRLSGPVSWYRIRYHECDHDTEPPSPCPEWTTEVESGPVPAELP